MIRNRNRIDDIRSGKTYVALSSTFVFTDVVDSKLTSATSSLTKQFSTKTYCNDAYNIRTIIRFRKSLTAVDDIAMATYLGLGSLANFIELGEYLL